MLKKAFILTSIMILVSLSYAVADGYTIYPDGSYGPKTNQPGYQIYPDGSYGPRTSQPGYQLYPDGSYGPRTKQPGYQIYPDGTYGPRTNTNNNSFSNENDWKISPKSKQKSKSNIYNFSNDDEEDE